MFGGGVCLFADSIRSVLDLACGDACPDARFEFLIGRNDGTGCYDSTVRNDSVVHDYGTHSDDDIVADDASVYIGSVTYGHIIADDAFRLLICSMQHRIVLNIHPVTEPDGAHISAKHGPVPYTAVITYADRSYQSRSFCKKCPFTDYGRVTVEFLYYCHCTVLINLQTYKILIYLGRKI